MKEFNTANENYNISNPDARKANLKCFDKTPRYLARVPKYRVNATRYRGGGLNGEIIKDEDGYICTHIDNTTNKDYRICHVTGWKHIQKTMNLFVRCTDYFQCYNQSQKANLLFLFTAFEIIAKAYISAKMGQNSYYFHRGSLFRHSTEDRIDERKIQIALLSNKYDQFAN